MNLHELYVLRHGETDWNRARRIQGQSESRLTPKGESQARDQGRILARLFGDGDWPAAHASPLLRARQTAALALGPRAGGLVLDARLAEVALGDWEGRLASDLVAEYPVFADPGVPTFRRCFLAPGGESYAALEARVRGFLDALSAPAIVVTHGIAGAVLRGLATGLDDAQMAALDRAQGCVFRIAGGVEEVLLPA